MSTISASGGITIYIKQDGGNFYHSPNNISWYLFSFPCVIENTNIPNGVLKIQFTTDMTFSNINNYFKCASSHIQFGSVLLKEDGSKPNITIAVDYYDGLIENGDNSHLGCNNIYIYNLNINATDYQTQIGAGWFAKKFFAKGAADNYIVNCSSNGIIGINSGGIVGQYAASSSGSLTIIGCSSSGEIGAQGGGIIGNSAASDDGTITCQSCFTSGLIGSNAGGIIGEGSTIGNVTITDCYTTGLIQSGGGGICGPNFASSTGTAVIINCYTTGDISESAGGISGGLSTNLSINNCYTTGNIIGTAAGGIAGIGGTPNITHCYTTGTTFESSGYIKGGTSVIPATCYSEAFYSSSSWSSINANTVLQNVPSPIIGNMWVAKGLNQPYELRNMGYTPYTTANIGITSGIPYLKSSISLTIEKGSSSIPAIISGKSYTILEKNNGSPASYSTITLNSTTGVITTTSSIESDVYTLYIRNTGSYNITQVTLTITSSDPIPCLMEDTMVLTPNGYINITKLKRGDLVITNNNKEVKIVNIFRSVVPGNLKTYPCVIPRNAIGQNYPPQELRISQNHLIKYHNLWILPKQFFPLDTTLKLIKYYHIQLENYLTDNLVINDGVVVESLANTPQNIKNNRLNVYNTVEYNRRCNTLLTKVLSKHTFNKSVIKTK